MSTSTVAIRIGQTELSQWLSYEIESDLLQPADAFSFTVPNPGGRYSDAFALYDAVQVSVDGTVQMSGYVDEIETATSANGTTLTVTGRDRFGQLLDQHAEPKTYRGLTLLGLARVIAAPFVTTWRSDNEANRAALLAAQRDVSRAKTQTASDHAAAVLAQIRAQLFPRVKVEPGQTVHQVLEDLAKRAGLLLWQAADGSGILGKPNYAQAPIYAIRCFGPDHEQRRTNNVESARVTRNGRERYQSYNYRTYGRKERDDSGNPLKLSSVAQDDGVTLRRRFVETETASSLREQRLLCEREMQRRRFEGLRCEYTMHGHTNSGKLWQIDTTVQIADAVNGINGIYYVTGRRFSGNDRGQRTLVVCQQRDLFLP